MADRTPKPRILRPEKAVFEARVAAPTALDVLLDQLAEAVAARVASRLPEDDGGYYSQDTSPLPRRAYLDLVRAGTLAARAIGKQRLVRKVDLHAWIETHPTQAGVPAPPPREVRVETETRRLDEILRKNRLGKKG